LWNEIEEGGECTDHEELEMGAREESTIGVADSLVAIEGTCKGLSKSLEAIRAMLNDVVVGIIDD
jgi:benzoyl-CoA reductase/2-hydroxyglutaryl-CoA dehydratase subunit BcrC/BadD/HgdB